MTMQERKKRRADSKEHKLFVDKAIMDLAYSDARREQIPRDEARQMAWALRESLLGQRTLSIAHL
jgi:predicted secreted Zn-dependent protease